MSTCGSESLVLARTPKWYESSFETCCSKMAKEFCLQCAPLSLSTQALHRSSVDGKLYAIKVGKSTAALYVLMRRTIFLTLLTLVRKLTGILFLLCEGADLREVETKPH